MTDYAKFQNLNYEKFREMACDNTLTCYEKIGFPTSYRQGYEEGIWDDIQAKLSHLALTGKIILDIGPGLSELPHKLIRKCQENKHTLILADAPEVLNQLPDEKFIIKVPGKYPEKSFKLLSGYLEKIDVIICYSVFHYIFAEGNIFNFLDLSLSLLAPQGQFLIGDIPNISKRKRFFSSPAGIKFHQDFTNTSEIPSIQFNCLEKDQIDDSVVFGLLSRCRNFGFNSYLLPQNDRLPMSNRREDVLIKRN